MNENRWSWKHTEKLQTSENKTVMATESTEGHGKINATRLRINK
jgi:hypothetical protein